MKNKILNLLIQNKEQSKPLNTVLNEGDATIYFYGVIVDDDYWGGISALTFAKELNALDCDTIYIRMQSPGGDVFAGIAMAQAIKEHKSHIVVHVDGMAASAATFLVSAADESFISEGAGFMIHNAWMFTAGNANELTKAANLLSRIDANLVADYAKLTGKSEEEIKGLMDEETYFLGQDAVDNGFIDKIAESTPKDKIDWNMSAYSDESPTNKKKKKVKNKQKKPVENSEKPDLSAHYRQLKVIELTA